MLILPTPAWPQSQQLQSDVLGHESDSCNEVNAMLHDDENSDMIHDQDHKPNSNDNRKYTPIQRAATWHSRG